MAERLAQTHKSTLALVSKSEPTYFNPNAAISALHDGKNPTEIFRQPERKFHLHDSKDLRADSAKKEIMHTLLAAASADVAHALTVLPLHDYPFGEDADSRPLHSGSTISPTLYQHEIQPLIAFVTRTEMSEAISQGESQPSIYAATFEKLAAYFHKSVDAQDIKTVIFNRLDQNSINGTVEIGKYFRVVHHTYTQQITSFEPNPKDFGFPTLGTLRDLANTSRSLILGRAARDEAYLEAYNSLVPVFYGTKVTYEDTTLVLKRQPNGHFRIHIAEDVKADITDETKTKRHPEVITGCPAMGYIQTNLERIDRYLARL